MSGYSVKLVRFIGGSLTSAAALALLIAHATIAPTPVLAAPCCQQCEAQESACYAQCGSISHGLDANDTLQSCYQKCDDDLWDSPYGCWTTCYYCNPSPSPSICYTFAIEHNYSCSAYDGNGNCTQWTPTGGPAHIAFSYQTGSQWCTQ